MSKTLLTLLTSVILAFTNHLALAGSATWELHPHNMPLWQDADNWNPATVPNGPNDIATFGVSIGDEISISATVEVNQIVFIPGASSFGISADQGNLTISGVGITNNSGITQIFDAFGTHKISFTNSATAGTLTLFVGSGTMEFLDSSTAGNSTFDFLGTTQFFGNSSASTGTFTMRGGNPNNSLRGSLEFFENSTAADGNYVNEGSTVSDKLGGSTSFFGTSTAASGTFTSNGGTISGASGGLTLIEVNSTADNATLTANAGTNGGTGGEIFFAGDSTGGASRLAIFGNGNMDISSHNAPGVTVGSIEGDGAVFLGANNLTVGSANSTTTFSGVIQDGGLNGGAGGSLTKIGNGTLTLTGNNTYTGGTVLSSGILLVNNTQGSGTGSGPVQASAGTFGGGGRVSGNVTVGTGTGSGAILAPGSRGVVPGTLRIAKTLTLKTDATYNVLLDSSLPAADKVVAKKVRIVHSSIVFADRVNSVLPPGTTFTIIDNRAATAIAGRFNNLEDNSIVTIGSNTYLASYEGGDGNDLTLTVVP